MKSPRSNAERSEATRRKLLRAARTLFIAKGFAATSTPEIVAQAQVTRGALYHHFVDKADLFESVAFEMAHEVAHAIASDEVATGSAFEQLRAGSRAYFAAMAKDGRARLILLEAPAVLESQQLLALSAAAGSVQLTEGLLAALEKRECPMPVVHAIAALLSAAFDRAALLMVSGHDADACMKGMDIIIDGLEAWNDGAPASMHKVAQESSAMRTAPASAGRKRPASHLTPRVRRASIED